jgi:hypothetical protein
MAAAVHRGGTCQVRVRTSTCNSANIFARLLGAHLAEYALLDPFADAATH